ncbi:MAG: efflux RND transporter permease subunit [Phycisphaerales bacterium]|nr:efflux RND transporter permease subunit [Phycisphaerales bacterium]
MLNWIIRSSLNNRVLVLIAALLVSVYGLYVTFNTPTDVLPDLNRPVVTIFGEAPGLAPEEVEAQVTYPIETAVNGAPGVERVRSRSALGLSIVYVEFTWGTDPKYNRQVVTERLGTVTEKLPPGIVPVMTPASSIMGEIALISASSKTLSPMDVRTQAEFVLRPAILSIPGIAQVTVMGGDLKQFRVQVDPDKLRLFDLTLEDVERALQAANQNTGGGFLASGAQELVVRNLGRVQTADDIAASLITNRPGDHESPPRAVLIRDVATVIEAGPTIKRGDGSENATPAVIMAIQKQPGADTLTLTRALDATLAQIKPTLPAGLDLNADLFRQEHFIRASIGNVIEALELGAVLVVIILVLFLMNVRTTIVTLTALPLSIITTFMVFHWLGMSVNTMTLGGLAVAIGELVDDAVVDVENVYRRLGENRRAASPRPIVQVVFDASSEIRNPIILGTVIVNLVFLPTFFLPGIEGRLFTPLATAYIISIFASLLVALTITPVLAFYLLPGIKRMTHGKDGLLLRVCKRLALKSYSISMPRPIAVLGTLGALVAVALFMVTRLGSEFLPPFNEGTATVSFMLTPGVSLEESNRIAARAEEAILSIPQVKNVGRRTGRAEQDEHAEGVHSSEIDVDLWTKEEAKNPDKHPVASGRKPPPVKDIRPREDVFAQIQEKLEVFPGVNVGVGQPISHRIEHLLSGVRAMVAVKIFGDDLNTLRTLADQTKAAMEGIPGVADLQVEQQVLVPQLHISVNRDAAARVGFTPAMLTDAMETATKGKVVGQVLEGLKSFDITLTLDDHHRTDPTRLEEVRLVSPTGAIVLLRDVAEVVEKLGPNEVARENLRRRIVVQCNVRGRDLGSTVKELQASIAMDVQLPQGYTIQYGGLYEAQQESTRLLLILGLGSLVAIFVILYTHYRSGMVAAQIMLNVPFALIGSVTALAITREPFSVASLVGFISLTGIATRNGVLMVSHYIHLMTEERQTWSKELIIRGSQERVAPVLMTAVTAGLGLIPLVLSKGEPGKEILYPVAVVILGGLITSTLLDFFVTPAIFYRFGKTAAERLAREHVEKHPHTAGEAKAVHHGDTESKEERKTESGKAASTANAAPIPSIPNPVPAIAPPIRIEAQADGKQPEGTA